MSSVDIHLAILRTFIAQQRGDVAAQAPRRALEQRVRQRARQLVDRLVEMGLGLDEAAQRLGVNARTLRHWEARGGDGAEAAPLLGRPVAPVTAAQQHAVGAYLDALGPGVGLPSLRSHFPELARSALDEMLKGYRDRWLAQHPRLLHVLHWQRPGPVWAVDFAEVPSLIDGAFGYVLAVRDLASGQQLLWQAVPEATAAVVRQQLRWLFLIHGAPWVLKSDNGPPFRADDTKEFLRGSGVSPLFSPPRTPSYNGSIEAAIGSLKTRTRRLAEAAGDPEHWTTALLEAARQEANASRPRRLKGASPDEVWAARPRLTLPERQCWQASVVEYQAEAWRERDAWPASPIDHWTAAEVDRVALRRALVAHGLLLFRRRSIPARIERPKTATRG